MGDFSQVLPVTLRFEGGKVNNPKDPGGRTAFGITQRTYDAWRTKHGLPRRDVYLISDTEKYAIYKAEYWDAIGGDNLDTGVAMVAFDYAVNSGTARALSILVLTKSLPPTDRINAICDKRLAFLRSLGTWGTFGKGWASRVEECRKVALGFAGKPVQAPKAPPATIPAGTVIIGSAAATTAHTQGLPLPVVIGVLVATFSLAAFLIYVSRKKSSQ